MLIVDSKRERSKTIYFVRHAESVGIQNSLIDPPESPLSRRGEKQLDALVGRLQSVKAELVVTSPYRRAVQTAEAIAK